MDTRLKGFFASCSARFKERKEFTAQLMSDCAEIRRKGGSKSGSWRKQFRLSNHAGLRAFVWIFHRLVVLKSPMYYYKFICIITL